MHRDEAAFNGRKFVFQLFFCRIHNHLRTLTKNKFLHLQKAPEVALKNMPGINFINLALIKKGNPINRFFVVSGLFSHTFQPNCSDFYVNLLCPLARGRNISITRNIICKNFIKLS